MEGNALNPQNNPDPKEEGVDIKKTEISAFGKLIAGFILITFMAGGLILLIGYWPDRLPVPGSADTQLYNFHFGKVTLVDSVHGSMDSGNPNKVNVDTPPKTKIPADITTSTSNMEVTPMSNNAKDEKPVDKTVKKHHRIHLNTLLFILVALAGFLGNMIFIATSFTTFVAVKKFERTWILWYFVKPFTAAILSVIVYLAFSAGFFSMNSGFANINLFGIIALAFVVGLSTDRATEKLKELIDVFMKPKEPRPGDMTDTRPKVKSIIPSSLKKKEINRIILTGTNLMDDQLKIFIEGTQISFTERSSDKITMDYTLPAVFEKSSVFFQLSLKEEKIYEANLPVQPEGA